MKKLFHIIATPREDESRTLRVSKAFVQSFAAAHKDWAIEEMNLFKEALPPLTVKRVDGKYALLSGKDLSGDQQNAWKDIVAHIERFLSADAYLVSAPMWNFGIPYTLKHYLDIIIQPKYMFRYTATGAEGLVKNKSMTVISSRGGDYSSEAMKVYDFQVNYLKAIFGFVGITDIRFVIAQPVDISDKLRDEKIAEAQKLAAHLATEIL